MTAMEVVILILGVLAFIASFVVKGSSKSDEERFSEEEIKELVNKEYENTKYKIKEASEDAVAESLEKAERSLEKLTNEKMLALGEYSDNIMSQISTNHQETVFMYDMLNKNKEELTNYVSEVKAEAEDAKNLAEKAKKDALSASDEAEVARNEAKQALLASEEAMKKNALAEEHMILARQAMEEASREVIPPVAQTVYPEERDVYTAAKQFKMPVQEENLDAEVEAFEQYLDEETNYEEQPSAESIIAEAEKTILDFQIGDAEFEDRTIPKQSGLALSDDFEKVAQAYEEEQEEKGFDEELVSDEMETLVETIKSEPLEEKVIPGEQSAYAQLYDVLKDEEPVIEENVPAKPESIKDLIKKTDAVKQKNKNINANSIKAALKKQADPTTFQFDAGDGNSDDTNARIIALHKKGKSNMAIAKEIGLGVGEVNLVIGLYDH